MNQAEPVPRVKNKGSQKKKPGRKRKKYQAPQSEHPETPQDIENSDIHANHVEGFNAALRRMCSAFRRKTNTYAKKTERLQERLNVIWILHNFVRIHHTTKEVPAVTLVPYPSTPVIKNKKIKRRFLKDPQWMPLTTHSERWSTASPWWSPDIGSAGVFFE
ncbi:hypothetical protein GKODMF_12500 [Candidatus Electrothrix gigas]